MTIFVPKMLNCKKSPDLGPSDSAADSSIPRTTKESGVKAKSKKLEDPIAKPKTPVKDSLAKPKPSCGYRPQ